MLDFRSKKLKEIIEIFQLNVQFDELLFLKDKDISRMNEYIKHLSNSIVDTSKTELALNERVREIARLKHDLSMQTNKCEHLEK